MKIYVAGPMTGLPQFNIPTFNAATAELRSFGYNVVSPAEQDSPLMQQVAFASKDGNLAELEKATGESWGHVLSRDVLLLSDYGIEAIALLPDWYKSRGARLEATVGLLNNLKFFVYRNSDQGGLMAVSGEYVLDFIHMGFRLSWSKR